MAVNPHSTLPQVMAPWRSMKGPGWPAKAGSKRRDQGEDDEAEEENGDDQPDDVVTAHAARRSCSAVPGARSAKASSSGPMRRSQAATNRTASAKTPAGRR